MGIVWSHLQAVRNQQRQHQRPKRRNKQDGRERRAIVTLAVHGSNEKKLYKEELRKGMLRHWLWNSITARWWWRALYKTSFPEWAMTTFLTVILGISAFVLFMWDAPIRTCKRFWAWLIS